MHLIGLGSLKKEKNAPSQLSETDHPLPAISEIMSIWTAGKFRQGAFHWANNSPVSAGYTRWSKRGSIRRPQPDNAEGFEDCIAVMNDMFNDGVAWHDEQCNYRKHFVCEL